ncbi:hypothetical protein SPAN111604_14320 [Sphingomonas antarctica]|uniref:hypothetical protein n=1 Tax=Sphingomonas antarctica TaxID=2040274 RepID=UPI0039E7DD8F
MLDSTPQRLGSFYLEDLSIVALAASADQNISPMLPELDEARRARLRSRIKQLGRHNWPSSLYGDPLLRRGYTLRQCCRLIATLMLLDAHLAPSDAIALAQANELSILRAIAPRLETVIVGRSLVSAADLLMVVPLGELVDLVAAEQWRKFQPQAIRLVRRRDLSSLWSADAELQFPGQRLVLDIGLAVSTAWLWMRERRLMTDIAVEALLDEVGAAEKSPGYSGPTAPIFRQR